MDISLIRYLHLSEDFFFLLFCFQKIDGIKRLWGEIASMRVTVPLSMFCLYAGKLNEDLCSRTDRLKDKITVFEVEENRDLNKT